MDRDMDHAGIVASTAGAAFAVDTAGRILAWNAAAEDLFGYPASKVVGRFCWEVVQGRDLCGNVYCGPHCPLIEMAVRRQAIHRCDLLYRHAEGETVRITSYNVCYTKLLRQPLAAGLPATDAGAQPAGAGPAADRGAGLALGGRGGSLALADAVV